MPDVVTLKLDRSAGPGAARSEPRVGWGTTAAGDQRGFVLEIDGD
jgi:hypothetical protein